MTTQIKKRIYTEEQKKRSSETAKKRYQKKRTELLKYKKDFNKNRSPERIEEDKQKKRDYYYRDVEKTRRLARERYHRNKKVSRWTKLKNILNHKH